MVKAQLKKSAGPQGHPRFPLEEPEGHALVARVMARLRENSERRAGLPEGRRGAT